MIHAAIDLGTNAIRFMVAEELNRGQIRVLHRERMVVRLGEGFGREKKILPQSLRRAVEAVKRFSAEAASLGAEKVRLAGTSVFREAENRESACRVLHQETGIPVQVISGEMEAGLASYGVIRTLGLQPENLIITDIGGGSSEVIHFPPADGYPSFFSLPLGAVWLTEKFLIHDPPAACEWEEMVRYCRSIIEQSLPSIFTDSLTSFIGTGGTATTLAAIEQRACSYDPDRINSFAIPLASLEELAAGLRSVPVHERGKVCGLEKGREDIILAGAAILLTLMRTLNITRLTVSDAGLLEGIIWHEISPSPFVEVFP
ncbi:MAG: Ppx/GppA phosphatase family protein [bacterium]